MRALPHTQSLVVLHQLALPDVSAAPPSTTGPPATYGSGRPASGATRGLRCEGAVAALATEIHFSSVGAPRLERFALPGFVLPVDIAPARGGSYTIADAAYRAYLMSLIASFQGVGTISGIKKAVSSGLLVDEDDVVIIEDFQQNKYDVRLLEWSAHSGSTVERLADLADPLAIELVKVQYDVGVDETRTADDVSVDSGLKVTDSATAADAVAEAVSESEL